MRDHFKTNPCNLHPVLRCVICGGQVVTLGSGRNFIGYRCEAEGVRWDATENLVIRTPDPGASPRLGLHDKETGRFVPAAEARA